MNQDRYTEYEDTMKNVSDYPEELDHMEKRLYKRIRRRLARQCLGFMGAFVGAFVLFTTAVNTSTVIAQTLENIPIIGYLAEYVKFDKGIQNAIKNQYAQEVNLEQEVNGYTLKMPYVIADSKRLVLFFQLPQTILDRKNANEYQVILDDSIYEKLDIRNVYLQNLEDEPGVVPKGLQIISIRADEAAFPQDITIPVSLVKLYTDKGTTMYRELVEKEHKPMILGTYEFKLHLKEFKEPITRILNQEVKVLDQTVVIQSVMEYPTGIEIKATAPKSNTAVISGIRFKGIDENGNAWSIPERTNPGYTYNGDTIDLIYYLENDYFNKASLTSLEITGVGMFMKADKEVMLDLVNQTTTPAISDLNIKNIMRNGDKADITFESTHTGLSEFHTVGTFDMLYEDLQGNVYDMREQRSSQMCNKTQYYMSVIWPKDNKVILERLAAPVTELEKPIRISLKK